MKTHRFFNRTFTIVKSLVLIILVFSTTSCVSFLEGMAAAMAGYNPYAYGYSNTYSSGNYLLNPSYAAAQATAQGGYSSYSSSSSSSSYNTSTYSSSSRKKDCPSLKANNGKWYCANTGKCGMCGGDGRMNGSFGQGANSLKCTLCNGSGRCQYCN